MTRRYADVVEVRASRDASPEAFLWRGRLYVVRAVLGHWRERRAWWTGTAAQALHGASDEEERREVGAEAGIDDGADDSADDSRTAPDAVAALAAGRARTQALGEEHEVWRVEAAPGRTSGVGVYDLCQAAPAGPWRLLRVSD